MNWFRFLSNHLDKFRPSRQNTLARWFTKLYSILEKAERDGKFTYQKWYQPDDGSELSLAPIGQLLYEIKILSLPPVVFKRKIYHTALSQTSFVAGIFPKTMPEIVVLQIDLTLKKTSSEKSSLVLEFTRKLYNNPNRQTKHEIRFNNGRLLTSDEFKFYKSVFDKAIRIFNFLKPADET